MIKSLVQDFYDLQHNKIGFKSISDPPQMGQKCFEKAIFLPVNQSIFIHCSVQQMMRTQQ